MSLLPFPPPLPFEFDSTKSTAPTDTLTHGTADSTFATNAKATGSMVAAVKVTAAPAADSFFSGVGGAIYDSTGKQRHHQP
jgi:hypothetical protein